jgi:hypothetical protein
MQTNFIHQKACMPITTLSLLQSMYLIWPEPGSFVYLKTCEMVPYYIFIRYIKGLDFIRECKLISYNHVCTLISIKRERKKIVFQRFFIYSLLLP